MSTPAGEDLERECQAAIEALARAETAPPGEVGAAANEAARALIAIRDALIHSLRADPGAAARRDALDRVNAALSLVVGLQYPASGVLREPAREARRALERLLAEGLLE